jgi:hypothetical protein
MGMGVVKMGAMQVKWLPDRRTHVRPFHKTWRITPVTLARRIMTTTVSLLLEAGC